MTMTGNDFALAVMAAQLAIGWHREQPASDFGAKEIEKLTALLSRVNKVLDFNPGLVEMTDGECEFEVTPI